MVCWWPGDGNANDIQGSNNGTVQGGATFAGGEVQQTFSFNGVDAYIDIPHNDNLNPTGPFSVDAWVKADPSQTYSQVLIVDKSHGWTDSTGWLMQTNPDGTACFGYGLGGGGTTNYVLACTQTSILNDQWHHLAGAWTGTEVQIYEDGLLQNVVSSTSLPANNSRNVHIGMSWGGGSPTRFFHGLLDEVEDFNRALSQAEIQSIVDAGGGGKRKPIATPTPMAFGGSCYEFVEVTDPFTGDNNSWFVAKVAAQASVFNGVNGHSLRLRLRPRTIFSLVWCRVGLRDLKELGWEGKHQKDGWMGRRTAWPSPTRTGEVLSPTTWGTRI